MHTSINCALASGLKRSCSRPATWAQSMFQPYLVRDLLAPLPVAEGLPARKAAADRCQFRFGFGVVDVISPQLAQWYGAFGQQGALFRGSMRSAVEAAPSPGFSYGPSKCLGLWSGVMPFCSMSCRKLSRSGTVKQNCRKS
jgi:hypothetical protein